jgi:sugar lactone lactonase YvrE
MEANMIDINCVTDRRNILGEGPVWNPTEQVLYWVDIREPSICRYDPVRCSLTAWTMPELIGSLAVRSRGGLLLALHSRLARFDPQTLEIVSIASPEADSPHKRFNDGKCDRRGRFWVGSMNNEVRGDPSGVLYRLDAKHECVRMEAGFSTPNSLAWSPDDKWMYFADTFTRTIFAYAFDIDSGTISNRRVFAQIPEGSGGPDGSTVDTDGCLWNAVFGGWCLHRYTPDGRVDRVVDLPISQPTSCAFGGPNLDILYVTSATNRLRPGELSHQPLAGRLLALDVGAKGLPEPYFAG